MASGFAQTVNDLEVYRIAFNTSIEIHKASLQFPKIEQYALADQLRRSSKSICANLAEGFGRQRGSKADFKRFILIATGSSDEVQVWLQYAYKLEYITQEQMKNWHTEYQKISRMLQAFYSSIKD